MSCVVKNGCHRSGCFKYILYLVLLNIICDLAFYHDNNETECEVSVVLLA